MSGSRVSFPPNNMGQEVSLDASYDAKTDLLDTFLKLEELDSDLFRYPLVFILFQSLDPPTNFVAAVPTTVSMEAR